MISPSHQVHQFKKYWSPWMRPGKNKQVAPIVAPTRQLTGPPRISILKIFVKRSSGLGNPMNRLIRKAPATACNVAPVAITTGRDKELKMVAASKALQKLTKKEPMKMPGHAPQPHNRMPPRATPAAGQTGVAYPGGMASGSASLPANKYAAARIKIWTDRLNNEAAGCVFTINLWAFLFPGCDLIRTIQHPSRKIMIL